MALIRKLNKIALDEIMEDVALAGSGRWRPPFCRTIFRFRKGVPEWSCSVIPGRSCAFCASRGLRAFFRSIQGNWRNDRLSPAHAMGPVAGRDHAPVVGTPGSVPGTTHRLHKSKGHSSHGFRGKFRFCHSLLLRRIIPCGPKAEPPFLFLRAHFSTSPNNIISFWLNLPSASLCFRGSCATITIRNNFNESHGGTFMA